MTDFYQNGVITTLHHLRHRSLQSIEDELVNFSKEPHGIDPPVSLFRVGRSCP